jgi:hypothetical protein
MKGVNFGVCFHLGIHWKTEEQGKGKAKRTHTKWNTRSSEDATTKTSQTLEIAPKERRSKEEEDKGKEGKRGRDY